MSNLLSNSQFEKLKKLSLSKNIVSKLLSCALTFFTSNLKDTKYKTLQSSLTKQQRC